MNIEVISTEHKKLTINIVDCIQIQIEQSGDEAFIDLDPRETRKLVEVLKDNIKEMYPVTGISLITQERKEQIEKHKIKIINDITFNNHYQLSQAAGLLCMDDMDDLQVSYEECMPVDWDLNKWTKICEKPYKERLIIAGALLAAEIDRLDSI